LVEWLVYRRRNRLYGKLIHEVLSILGLEIPDAVKIGPDLTLPHRGRGVVIHPWTTIGSRVRIYHQVTIGRADVFVPEMETKMVEIVIGDDAILAPGARILGGKGITRIGAGAIIGANAVVTRSVPENEIWAGVPAKRIGTRNR